MATQGDARGAAAELGQGAQSWGEGVCAMQSSALLRTLATTLRAGADGEVCAEGDAVTVCVYWGAPEAVPHVGGSRRPALVTPPPRDGSTPADSRDSSSPCSALSDTPGPSPSASAGPLKRSAFSKKRRPVLPSIIRPGCDGSSAGSSSGAEEGVNPFEPGRIRKVRSCELFFQQADAAEGGLGAADPTQVPADCPRGGAPSARGILKRSCGEARTRKRTLSWCPLVTTPVATAAKLPRAATDTFAAAA